MDTSVIETTICGPQEPFFDDLAFEEYLTPEMFTQCPPENSPSSPSSEGDNIPVLFESWSDFDGSSPISSPENSTPSSYPLYPSPSLPCTPLVVPDLEVVLSHKKRGSGGIWQPIKPGERIRVTKSKGKLIRLVINENGLANRIDWNDKLLQIQLLLVDSAHPDAPAKENDGFTIEPPSRPTRAEPTFRGREFKLKLTKICRGHFFFVTVTGKDGLLLNGSSIEFRSDDNGKIQNSKKRKRVDLENSPDLREILRQGLMAYSDVLPGYANNDELVNLIACSLVPVILDNFPLLGGTSQDATKKLKTVKACSSFVQPQISLPSVLPLLSSVKCESV